MLIKLNKYNKQAAHYTPPVPVGKKLPGPTDEDSAEVILEKLLWVPAILVSQFLHQFPALRPDADELFSVGVLTLSTLIDREDLSANDVARFAKVRCCRAMEDYANTIESVILVNPTARYRRRKKYRAIPMSVPVGDTPLSSEDDHTDLHLRDAAEHLGLDLDNLSARDKRKLERLLA